MHVVAMYMPYAMEGDFSTFQQQTDSFIPDMPAAMWPNASYFNCHGAVITTMCTEALVPLESTAVSPAAHSQHEHGNQTAGGDSAQVTFQVLERLKPEAIRVGTWSNQMPTTLELEENGKCVKREENCSKEEELDVEVEDFGDPIGLADNFEQSDKVISRLETADCMEKQQIIKWLQGTLLTLAQSKHSCRVVQKALEVAGSMSRNKLVAELELHVEMLYKSPHGNYVLSKLVETVPSAALQPVIRQLQAQGPITVAKHRFGCRVLERLIEHCSEHEILGLIGPIIANSEMLCRHVYGNFIIQHLVEQGSPARRMSVLNHLLSHMPYLAMHRTASHVVQRVLEYSDKESLQMIVAVLLCAESPNSFVDIACSRYGSFVTEQFVNLRLRSPECFDKVHCYLAENVEKLGQGLYGKRVAECFGLDVPSPNESVGA